MISDSTPDRPEFSLAGVIRGVVDLDGSLLGDVLEEHWGERIEIAPTLGTVEGKRWFIEWDDDGPTVKECDDDL